MPGGKLTPKEFYDKYYPMAVKYTRGTNISPETFMSQFATESSWGATANPENGFAIFGIKAGDGQSAITHDTTEENKAGQKYKAKANFRSYGSLDEAMQDYVKLMQTPKYAGAFKTNDPIQQLKGIQDAGYGSKTYANLTSDIVRQNKKYIPMSAGDIDTKKELNQQLADYKKKAKDGKLTPAEFKEVKLLLSKAQTIIGPGHDFNVFSHEVMQNVMRPYLVNDVQGFTKGAEDDIKNLKGQLVKAKTQAEYDDISNQIKAKEIQKKSAQEKADKIHNMYNDMAEKEKEIYKSEEDAINELKGTIASGRHIGATLDEASKGFRAEAIKKYGELYTSAIPELYKTFEDSKREMAAAGDPNARQYFEVPEFTYGQNNANAGVGGGSGSFSLSQSTYTPIPFKTPSGFTEDQLKNFKPNINDMSENEYGFEGNAFASKTTNPDELKKQIDLDKQTLDQLKQPTMEGYEPEKKGADYAGYLMDIGRLGLGLKGATEKLPDYNTSAMFNTYMQEAENRRNMGLSQEELGFRKQMADRAFAYDVKNVRNFSGGSAGVALANLGRANQQLYQNYGQVAAEDEQVRRGNRDQFYSAALQNENVNQYKFGIENERAMMNKQAGAELVNDSLHNILNRKQYEDAYGPGSQYYNYMNELTAGQKQNNDIMKQGMDQRKNESIADLQTRLDENQKRYEQLTGNYSNTDAIKNNAGNLPATTGLNWGQDAISKYQNLTPEQLKEQGITVENKGTSNEIITAEREMPAVNQVAGTKMEYSQVMNTPEHKAAIEKVHSDFEPQIADLKAKINAPGISVANMKTYDKQIRELEAKRAAEIDRLTKEQEKWADTQFDKDGKYIGK